MEERKPYGSFSEFMKQEGNAAMYKQNRQKIQAAEIELKEFIERFKKYEDGDDQGAKDYYNRGVKWRWDDLDFMKKNLVDFTQNGRRNI